jgi:hypothetical protein
MKDFTVVIASFAYASYFIAYISAPDMQQAEAWGVGRADAETGVPEYECLAVFDGCVEQSCSVKIFDWR